MRQFLRDIWKTQPPNHRPPWKTFVQMVKDGHVKIMTKREYAKRKEATKDGETSLDKKIAKE